MRSRIRRAAANTSPDSWAKWHGRINVLSKSDITNMAIIASGMTAMNLPITPLTKNSGVNAMTVVAMDAITDGSTS